MVKLNLDDNYIHLHSNGVIEKRRIFENINSDNIEFKIMEPINWKIREESRFIFITGLSNFKLYYLENYLD